MNKTVIEGTVYHMWPGAIWGGDYSFVPVLVSDTPLDDELEEIKLRYKDNELSLVALMRKIEEGARVKITIEVSGEGEEEESKLPDHVFLIRDGTYISRLLGCFYDEDDAKKYVGDSDAHIQKIGVL